MGLPSTKSINKLIKRKKGLNIVIAKKDKKGETI